MPTNIFDAEIAHVSSFEQGYASAVLPSRVAARRHESRCVLPSSERHRRCAGPNPTAMDDLSSRSDVSASPAIAGQRLVAIADTLARQSDIADALESLAA